VEIAHNVLVRAIRHAERDDLAGRNVAALIENLPKGPAGGAAVEVADPRADGGADGRG
jgi:hypothetical protein